MLIHLIIIYNLLITSQAEEMKDTNIWEYLQRAGEIANTNIRQYLQKAEEIRDTTISEYLQKAEEIRNTTISEYLQKADEITHINIWEYLQIPGAHLHLNRKTTFDRINELGYPCEEHEVKTEDGYIITIYRIPHSPKDINPLGKIRPKVLLQHALFGTSDTWILSGSENSLPFLLADRGYDVWLGNSRGNLYGRKHENLDIHQKQFWSFSWHEIGYYDMASIIDYMLRNEANPQYQSIHLIGHSQSTSAALVLLSLRQEYQERMRTIHLMAPVVYLDNTNDTLIKVLSPILGYHNLFSMQFNRQEFIPFNELYSVLAYSVCNQNSMWKLFCSPMVYLVEGSIRNKNKTALEMSLETHPGGVSTGQLLHFMQLKYSSKFRQFDFGHKENLIRYNQSEPPEYPLQQIENLLHIWYGDGDQTVNPIDVLRFAKMMTDVRVHRVPDVNWSHGDFVFSEDVRVYINDPLIDILDDYEGLK
ncbi:lipase 3-like [Haematobia irritans]|uniref:lipase 3-like n=1 Tax=Haematobia irritans TaxID=7368 RepID=UPI003F50911E